MYKIKLKKISYKLRIVDQRLKCGFSLLEILIAITVITVGLVGVMGLIVHNISLAKVSPERVIAVNLAQEGIEGIRNKRDSNWLAGFEFYKDIRGPNVGGRDYTIELSGANPSSAWTFQNIGTNNIDDDKYNIYYNTVNKFYLQDNTGLPANCVDTPFNRKINVEEISLGGGQVYLKVVSQVKWTDRSGATHTVTLEDHLYDWK